MEILNELLPVLLYMLSSVLLIVLIILSLKIIRIVDKAEIVVNDVEKKVKSLNGFFAVLDKFTDKVSFLSDKMVLTITNVLSKIFERKRKDDNNE